MESEIGGQDFSGYSFESQGQNESGPGRPSEQVPEILRRNAIELQFGLERNWGEVGWLLGQAKTEADIRAAFQRIVNPRCSLLLPFTRDHAYCTDFNLRRLRKRERDLGKLRRRHLADVQDKQRNRDYLDRAWAAEANTLLRGQIHNELARCERDLEEAASIETRSRTERETVQTELVDREAHFAQSEILKHLQTNRRRFTPLNVARAMAGLPLVTARVSSERCTEYGITQPNGTAFEVFRMIERALKEPITDLGGAMDALQRRIVSGCEKGHPSAAELRKNWYFIKSAVQSAMRDAKAPFGSLPFRVFADYCTISSSHSIVQALHAQAASLEKTMK